MTTLGAPMTDVLDTSSTARQPTTMGFAPFIKPNTRMLGTTSPWLVKGIAGTVSSPLRGAQPA
jgi:hypothetical protein